ncbi:hypothetical protein ACHAXH_003229, partial [Discostella pseudostelligera]
MASVTTRTPCPQDYGSIAVNNGANNNNNNSMSTTPTRASIRLHSTLDSIAFRSSPTPTTPPSFSPMSGAENHTNGHERQFQPLIRMLSSPTTQNVGNANTEHNSTSLPSGGRHCYSLDTPLLLDDSDKKINGNATIASKGGKKSQQGESFIYYIVYALVNAIMCVPCLYGYASVVFAHDVYQSHINALSKLVIFSSLVHQCCFSIFSTLPFAIGQVQDAGLIFLSGMSHKIATSILNDHAAGSVEGSGYDDDVVAVIVSTTIVLLGLATASLGGVLILAGKFRFADAVAYLPLPVVGGYLAFIGYFCVEAGVALCLGTVIMKPSDWAQLFHEHALELAIPGILAGAFLTFVARKCNDEVMLPISMIIVPCLFYLVLFFHGYSISDAREGGWVGVESPPVPVRDLFNLIDFGKVRWDLGKQLLPTWAGMVFVVSFSSCLDVAAISMDMGEALDTNNELMTVGISNFVSGLTGGLTGSYIFSQTIFTYRTGCRSRWIGVLVAFIFLAVVVSPINFLEITPLFFLGSTLIFIGFDLLYEWIVDVRHKLLFSEYVVLLATFIAIQIVGIDGGIGLGIAVAVFDYVWTSANVSSVVPVARRSLTLWSPQQRTYIENHVYNAQHPKIVTLECRGSVFFGSSMQFLSSILDKICINPSVEEKAEINVVNSPIPNRARHSANSPLPSASSSPTDGYLQERRRERAEEDFKRKARSAPRAPPRFLVLDLSSVSNIDASAARGCFLQLAKICAAREIVVCAAGANSRIDWIMQTHDAAQHVADGLASGSLRSNEKIILFNDFDEALQYCERNLLAEAPTDSLSFRPPQELISATRDTTCISLSTAFTHFIGLEPHDAAALIEYEKQGNAFHSEKLYTSGETIFLSGTDADGFFVVLGGSVLILQDDRLVASSHAIFSGAGIQHVKRRNVLESGQVSRVLSVGSVFGFVDFVLKRPRTFSVVAGKDARVAKCHRSGLDELKLENSELDRIIDRVLL